MRTIELYRKHKAGEVSREKFLYEVRRNKDLPWVTNITSYDDAVKILKNKGIISEADARRENYRDLNEYDDDPRLAYFTPDEETAQTLINLLLQSGIDVEQNGSAVDLIGISTRQMPKYLNMINGIVTAKMPDIAQTLIALNSPEKRKERLSAYMMNESHNATQKLTTSQIIDRLNPYFLKRGVNKLLAKEKELTNDSYINALNKAAKQLEANPHAFDEDTFANAKEVEKADAKLKTQEVKKNNHIDKANEMKKVKVKSLKESAIEELTNHLKKKVLVNEDAHYNHNVGSLVHTPDGPGNVVEIVGGTLTVEMEDGRLVDVQINTVDHFTQKAQEEPEQTTQAEPSAADMWANWKGNPFSGMIGDPEHFKKPLDLSKIKQYVEMYKGDKEKMAKLKEALKKLKENISDEEIVNAKKTGEVVNVPSSNQQDIQKLKNKKVAYSTYQG